MESRPANSSPRRFATTRWTLVAASAGDDTGAKQALSDLCAAYYEPVLAFLITSGRGAEEARDLAHEFFARVLQSRSLGAADPQRGRFRSYLLGAVKHFLADQHDRNLREKRGGGLGFEPLKTEVCDQAASGTPGLDLAEAEQAYDRKWALTVLARALEALQQKQASSPDRTRFEALKPWLTGEEAPRSQAEVARDLGINEGAVKVAVHRLRKQFRDEVKAEIIRTLDDLTEAQNEMHALLQALR